MNVYIDGAYFDRAPGTPQKLNKHLRYIAWGIVIEGADIQTEISGAHRVVSYDLNGCHEIVAFIEAALYLSSHGYRPEQISFISDDETVCYGSGGKTRANGYEMESHHLALQNWLVRVVKKGLYTQAAVDAVQPFIDKSRFHKIKGHRACVLNHRCDYLAKKAAGIRHFGAVKVLGFMEWMKTAQLKLGGEQHAIPFSQENP